jgi:uncharacterized protein (DUF302 family)
LLLKGLGMTENGIITQSSPHSVAKTLERLEATVLARGLAILARIDHSGDAVKAGLQMPPTELLIFGNPKAGTPLMIVSPTLAIDLPLKALVWEDGEGKVWVSYNSPEYLQQRHHVPDTLLPKISGVGSMVAEALR